MTATPADRTASLCSRLTADLEPLDTDAARATWRAESTGESDAYRELEELNERIMGRLSDAADFAEADSLLAGNGELDERARRELTKWRNRLAEHQFDADTIARLAREEAGLGQVYNSFRAEIGGRTVADNEIDRILLETDDSAEAEAAWRASKRIADARRENDDRRVADRLRDLVRLRNQAARQIGYDNGYRASLELGEMGQDWLYDTLGLLEQATRPLFERWKAELEEGLAASFGVDRGALAPWHYRDRFFQSPPPADGDEVDAWLRRKSADDIVEMTVRSFDELGFDVRGIVAGSDLEAQDPATSRKCQHAFCLTVVAPSDVRILCNVTPGERWMSTCLHEFGHGIYGSSLDAALPYILRDDPHTLCNEAIALLMERQMLDAGWLSRVAGFDDARAEALARRGRRDLARKHLVFTRWVLVMCHFERALYENPDHDDLGGLWWDLVERFQGVRRPTPDDRADDWAAKIHFVGHPAYYQNYLIGEVFGAQLQHAVEAECGNFVGNPEAGRFLRDRMFRSGATLHWRDLIEELSGELLDPRYFLEALRAAE